MKERARERERKRRRKKRERKKDKKERKKEKRRKRERKRKLFFHWVFFGKVRLCDGEGCGNPCSLKCHHFMCRQCCRLVCLEVIFSSQSQSQCDITTCNCICRTKSRAEILDCPTHKMFKKTLTERAKQKEAEEQHGVEGGGEEIVVRTEA